MTWLSINPDSEPFGRRMLAAEIQGKLITSNLTPQEMAEAYNLIEQMGCAIPPPGTRSWIPADSHDWKADE